MAASEPSSQPPRRLRLGILTPSSNTALEPLTHSLLSSLPNISVHFSRFRVTCISLSPTALSQFQTSCILASAQLLADAKVDMIGWSGTSAGWIGFEADMRLCQVITETTGIPATSSVVGLNKALKYLDAVKVGLVTPYMGDVQDAIVRNYYGGLGVDMRCECHLGIVKNNDIAEVGEDVLDRCFDEVIKKAAVVEGEGRLDAVTTFCTNLRAAQRVVYWEKMYNVPVLDTVTTVVWDMLRSCGQDTKMLSEKWGRIFDL